MDWSQINFRPWHDPIQQDLFEADAQSELFEPVVAPPAYRPDLDQVRARLHKILAEARAAEKLPWDQDKLLVYRTIFPQMTGWLPQKEGRATALSVRGRIGAPGGGLSQ